MRSKATYSPELEQWLRSAFRYDKETGDITQIVERRKPNGQIVSPSGRRALHNAPNGYKILTTKFGGRNYLIRAHRLAFFLETGVWPDLVDHINGDKQDNRWCNLRVASNSLNAFNRKRSWGKNSHLPVGICKVVKNGYECFKVSLTFAGKTANTYKNTLEKAIAWREQKTKEMVTC